MLSPEAEHLSVRGNLATVAAGRRVGPIEVTRIRKDGQPVTI